MNPNTAADFLAELAHGVPALPQAACRSHRDIFDDLDSTAVDRAVEICSHCVEREPCARWADTQPPRSLLGVVGGTLRHYDFRYTTTSTKENKR